LSAGLLEPDLRRELDAAVANIASDRHHLRRLGISLKAEARAGFIGTETIAAVGRLYHPDPAGFGALVIGVWSDEPPSALASRDDAVLMDLLAFNTSDPDRWWRRVGVADAVLGVHLYHMALDTGRSITLHDNPLAWLRADCHGACPVEWIERCRPLAAETWGLAA
jgi:hypothetical protein